MPTTIDLFAGLGGRSTGAHGLRRPQGESKNLEILAKAPIHNWDLRYRRGEITLQEAQFEIQRIKDAQAGKVVW